jgi:hypothetical protein
VVDGVRRPLFMEVPLGIFAGVKEDGCESGHREVHHDAEVTHDGQF